MERKFESILQVSGQVSAWGSWYKKMGRNFVRQNVVGASEIQPKKTKLKMFYPDRQDKEFVGLFGLK